MMEMAGKPTKIARDPTAILGVANAEVAARLASEVERFTKRERVLVARSLLEMHLFAIRRPPNTMVLDGDLIGNAPLVDTLRPFTRMAPVILIAGAERQVEAAQLVATGELEFVSRAGEYLPLAASLVERRLRWAAMSEPLPRLTSDEFPADFGTIFRHEINNPLTGILGNAELLLAHRERLTGVDTQRLQTVVELAVRLRETIRRISNAWESRQGSPRSA
jgi:signal transduction histidine kinase